MVVSKRWLLFNKPIENAFCSKFTQIESLIKDKCGVDKTSVDQNGTQLINSKEPVKMPWKSNRWIYERLTPYCLHANQISTWKYDIQSCEPIVFLKYTQGESTPFNRDGRSDSLSVYRCPNDSRRDGYVRKITLFVILNDEYEGGGLEFSTCGAGTGNLEKPKLVKGSVIAFPSFTDHRISTVARGSLHMLKFVFLGPPFR